MFYQKVLLLLVSLIFVSMVYAQENASVADEAQTQADKIADVAAELQRLSAEAESSGDSKLKDCIDGNLGAVKGLASSASGMVSRIASLAEAGKADEAASQLEALNGMAESADQLLAKAQSCEGGDPNKAQTKKESDSQTKKPATSNTNAPATANVNANVNVNTADAAESDSKAESDTNAEAATEESTVDDNTSVSDAMSLDMGSDMVTETERNVEGSDNADAAGADASDVQQSGNETTADDFTTEQTPTDTTSEPLPEHEPEEIEQSPTR